MYIPKCFEVTDREQVFSFVQNHAFGKLISLVDNRPIVTHVPFLLSENRSVLLTHLAKQNPQWETIDSQEALIVFSGPLAAMADAMKTNGY